MLQLVHVSYMCLMLCELCFMYDRVRTASGWMAIKVSLHFTSSCYVQLTLTAATVVSMSCIVTIPVFLVLASPHTTKKHDVV